MNIGQTISHFTIISRLGAGGMGVVYKAEDTKLHRIVALKLLPPHMLSDETIRQRFYNEAQAAASLNHPNVCAIHSIGEDEGMLYIEMEYVDGETLRERLERGPLEMSEAVAHAVQIGEALQEAHGQGIVHRDIKSDNIMINSRGTVKVMDFGLAKLKGGSSITRVEKTVGTLAYMSPEQLQSGNVDARSDLFSFGVVLFEMLTGHRPFRGEYEAAILYSIINEPPEPIQKSLPATPSELLHVLDTALEKKPEHRYLSAEEMVRDLRRVLRQSSPELTAAKSWESNAFAAAAQPVATAPPVAPVPSPSRLAGVSRHKTVFLVAAAAVAVIAIGAFLIPYLRAPVERPTVFARHQQVTFTANASYPAISPDGEFIAYVAKDSLFRVMVQDIGGGNAIAVSTSAREALGIHWSPGGEEVLVVESGFAYSVPRLGGTRRYLEHVPLSPGPKTAWSPDGAQIATTTIDSKRIRFIRRSDGDTSSIPVRGSYKFIYDIDWSPDGKWLCALTRDQDTLSIHVISRDGSTARTIVRTTLRPYCPRWTRESDAILFLQDHGQYCDLMKVRFDPDREAAEPPVVLQTGLQSGAFFSLSADNAKLLYSRRMQTSNLWRVDWGGGASTSTRKLTSSTAEIVTPSISPDGREVAFSLGNATRSNIYIMPREGGEMRQLTFFDSRNTNPVWSPDGKSIAFSSNERETHDAKRGVTFGVWIVPSSGGTPRRLDTLEVSTDMELQWAPSRMLFYQLPGNRNFSMVDPSTGISRPIVQNENVGWMFFLQVSPDDARAAIQWNRKPDRGLWVVSLPDSSQRLLVPENARPLLWSRDGKWLYFTYFTASHDLVYEQRIYRILGPGGKIESVCPLAIPGDITEISLNERTKSVVCCAIVDRRSDIWLMEGFDASMSE